MEIRSKTLTADDIYAAVRRVNRNYEVRYGHIRNGRILDSDGNQLRGGLTASVSAVRTSRNGTTYRVKLGAVTGSPASRLSASGRRGPWACWYAFRDFFTAIYAQDENAVIRTRMATYRGEGDFQEKFPETFRTPVGGFGGSQSFGSLCHPMGWHDWHDAEA